MQDNNSSSKVEVKSVKKLMVAFIIFDVVVVLFVIAGIFYFTSEPDERDAMVSSVTGVFQSK